MTLTRQHFQMIADVFRTTPTSATTTRGLAPARRERAALAAAMADALAATNGQFDRARFLKACGVEA